MLTVNLTSSLTSNKENIKYDNDLQVKPTLDLTTSSMYFSQYEHKEKLIKENTHNNLINTFLGAYNNHLPLRIRPDDIQLAIQMVIATCINNNAEKMRHLFVEHEGKMKLSVEHNKFDVNYFCDTFKSLMQKNIKDPEFVTKFTTRYTTTTQLISTVSNMMLMNTLKEYFSFQMILSCGIPSVIMEGTQEDWNLLKSFYDYFKDFLADTELKVWFPHFDIVMNMFIEMRMLQESGEVEATFNIKALWTRVISIVPQGSGGDTILGGWVRLLVPYSSQNKLIGFEKKIECLDITKQIPEKNKYDYYTYQNVLKKYYFASGWNSMQTSYVTTPAKLIDYDETEYEVEFYSGFFSPVLNGDMSISTNIGFIMREDQAMLKTKEREKYIELGVIKSDRTSLKIPALLYEELDNILSAFNECCSVNFYVPDKEKRKQYYIDNGVTELARTYKNGKPRYDSKILNIPEQFRKNLKEVCLCFDIYSSSAEKECTFY
jgi:hypothetical protein